MLIDVCRRLRHEGGSVAVCRVRPEMAGALHQLKAMQVAYFVDKAAALAAPRW
jgi:anti-anti-sigma regulatory factor